MEVTLSLIEAMTERIVEKFKPHKVILFGSWARGEATGDSDVDLLVIMDCQKGDYLNQMTAIRKELRDFRIPKDIIIANPDTISKYGQFPGYIYQSALREGRVVYEQ